MKVTNPSTLNPQVIDKKNTDRLSGPNETNKSVSPEVRKGLSAGPGSLVEISDDARLMQRAVEVAKQGPSIQSEKVAQLKKAIQDGSYKVDAQKIADRLVEEHLGTDFGKNNL